MVIIFFSIALKRHIKSNKQINKQIGVSQNDMRLQEYNNKMIKLRLYHIMCDILNLCKLRWHKYTIFVVFYCKPKILQLFLGVNQNWLVLFFSLFSRYDRQYDIQSFFVFFHSYMYYNFTHINLWLYEVNREICETEKERNGI